MKMVVVAKGYFQNLNLFPEDIAGQENQLRIHQFTIRIF